MLVIRITIKNGCECVTINNNYPDGYSTNDTLRVRIPIGGCLEIIIRIVQERLNSNLKVGGIVITQFDRRKTLNRSVREIVNDSFHEKVFKTVIRDNVALAEAPINGKTIFEYNPKSNGASDYMSLAKEVLNLK